MKIQCGRMLKTGNGHAVAQCPEKATLYVKAYGGRSWDGYFCDKHGPAIIKVRMRLVKRHKQNVVVRPVTEWDKKRRRKSK